MNYSRKRFLGMIGAGALTAAVPRSVQSQPLEEYRHKKFSHPLKLGLASYSLRTLSLDEVIKVAKRLRLNSIALKSMHLPLDSTPDQIKAAAEKVRASGLDLYGAGVIYMKSEDAVNNAFTYAKTAGLRMIIGVPNPELLPLVEKWVKETDIKVAIHNHGPGDKVYPSPDDVYEKVKNYDQRIGLCIDIGHTFRIGEDPVEKTKKYADRLYDVHLKDVDQRGAKGTSQELGRGIMDIPAYLHQLRKMKYTGVVGMEFEKDGKDPVPGLAECAGYARGIIDATTP